MKKPNPMTLSQQIDLLGIDNERLKADFDAEKIRSMGYWKDRDKAIAELAKAQEEHKNQVSLLNQGNEFLVTQLLAAQAELGKSNDLEWRYLNDTVFNEFVTRLAFQIIYKTGKHLAGR